MRIIAGELGGRTLLPPPSDTTRPITDRAKQSLFDNLAVTLDLDGAVVLDCFSGTGSMGLESLSRGAKKAIFIERDRGALKNLRANIESLGVAERSVVLPVDAYRVAGHELLSGPGAEKLTVAFVDPPYAHVATGHQRHKVDQLIADLAKNCLSPDGLISLRHPSAVSVDAAAMGVRVLKEFRYGDMGITWLGL